MSLDPNKMDMTNIMRAEFDGATSAQKILPVGGQLVPDKYDQIALSYVASGNGAGQIYQAMYYLSGVLVATLTLSYDSSNRISNVART